jgi:hypothetical protein
MHHASQGYHVVTGPDFPNVRFYVNDKDGEVSVSEHGCWLSAFFISLDAAKSWSGNFVGAEEEFRRLNAATGGKGSKCVGMMEKVASV